MLLILEIHEDLTYQSRINIFRPRQVSSRGETFRFVGTRTEAEKDSRNVQLLCLLVSPHGCQAELHYWFYKNLLVKYTNNRCKIVDTKADDCSRG